MNKVILLGRITRDIEINYTKSNEPIAVANYSLAVNKAFKKEGELDAEFINCVAFGKTAEFAQKYFKKGIQISIVGRIQTRSFNETQSGQKRYVTEVVVEEQYFAESKKSE